jgi:lysophospholipase L1-like esterase
MDREVSAQRAADKSFTSTPPPLRGVLRRYVPRLILALVAGLAALKIADVASGRFAGTRERHLLRLAPGASLRHKSNEFDYTFRTNKLGFRGPDVPFDKPAGMFRIVVLGDSFVAGYGLAEEHLLTRLLQERIEAANRAEGAVANPPSRVEVVNVGRVGTSTIRELDLYEALGRRFGPDLVILAYYLGNDLAEVMQEQTDRELAKWHPDGWPRRLTYASFPNLYMELAMLRQSRRQLREFTVRSETEIVDDLRQEARARGRDADRAVERFRSLPSQIRRDVASGMLSEQRIIDSCIEPDRLVRALDPDDADFDRAWARTKTHLDLLNEAVTRDGAKLVLVAIPAPFQVDRWSLEFHKQLGYEVRESWLEAPPRTALALADWAQLADVPLLDLTERLRDTEWPGYFIEDVHFTPEGSAEAAAAIGDFLLSQRLCP